MLKVNKSALALAVSLGMASGFASASFVDIRADVQAGAPGTEDTDVQGATSGAVEVDALWTAQVAVPVDLDDSAAWPGAGAAGNRSVIYSSDVALVDGSTLTFAVTGGALQASTNLKLFAYDTTGAAYVQVGSLNDFTADGSGNYTEADFQIDTDGAFSGTQTLTTRTGATAALSSGDPIPAEVILVLADSADAAFDAGENVVVVANMGLGAGSEVTIAVTEARDDASNPLNAPLAGAEDILAIINGVAASIDVVTSTIDVEADPTRTLFVDEGLTSGDADADTDTDTSQAVLTMTNSAEFGLTLDAGDTWTLSVTRSDVQGVDSLDVTTVGGSGTLSDAAPPAGGADTFQVSSDFGSDDLVGANTDIDLEVGGVADILNTGTWTATLSIDPDVDAGEPFNLVEMNITGADGDDSHIWEINGAQFKIPYHAQNAAGFNFFMNIVNEDDNDAEISADVIVQNKTSGGAVSLDDVDLGLALAGESNTIGQAAIAAAINTKAANTINGTDIYHVHMTVTVNAPRNSVHVGAFQTDSNGRTEVPVLYSIGNTSDERDWQ